MKKYSYETNCVSSTAEAIIDMVDNAKASSYQAMLRNCIDFLETAKVLGYTIRGKGLKLKDEGYVGYYRSKYLGKPCYFFKWSGIEYIFTKRESR